MTMVRRRWGFALLVSVVAMAVAVVWLAVPDTYPYGSGENVRSGVNHLIERGPGAVLLLTFAALGIVLATVALRSHPDGIGLRVAGIGAAVEAAFFAFVLADSSVMSALGYAVALTAPIGVVAALVLVCRKWRRLRYPLALLLLLVGAVGVVTGVLGEAGEAVADYLSPLLSDPEGYYPRTAWSLGMAGVAACWAWVALGSLLRTLPSWATPEAAVRWGRVVTVVAALGPVPYGLARLSWLTPWPLGGRDPVADRAVLLIRDGLDSSARIQGGLFALACIVGVVLTLGLIRGWGEIFPRWVPVLSGRAVPIKLAVIPGTVVAAIITISAPNLLLMAVETGEPREIAIMLVAFPFPIWGPALGAAVFAYWLRRRAAGHGGIRPAAAFSAPSGG